MTFTVTSGTGEAQAAGINPYLVTFRRTMVFREAWRQTKRFIQKINLPRLRAHHVPSRRRSHVSPDNANQRISHLDETHDGRIRTDYSLGF